MDDELSRICTIVARVGEMETLGPDDDFYAAGIDSMKAMDVMLDMETEFGVTVPDEQFVTARTPRALHALLQQQRGA